MGHFLRFFRGDGGHLFGLLFPLSIFPILLSFFTTPFVPHLILANPIPIPKKSFPFPLELRVMLVASPRPPRLPPTPFFLFFVFSCLALLVPPFHILRMLFPFDLSIYLCVYVFQPPFSFLPPSPWIFSF